MNKPSSRVPTEAAADFSIGQVIGRSASLFGRHVVLFVLVGGFLMLPSFFVLITHVDYAFPIRRFIPGLAPKIAAYFTASGVAAFFLQNFSLALIVWIAFEHLNGRRARIDGLLRAGATRFLGVTAISFCQSFGLIVAFTLMGGQGWILKVSGAVLLVPGLAVMALLFVAPAAYVVGRSGVLESLRRGVGLTRGHRIQVVAIYVFVTIGALAMSRGLTYLLRTIGSRTVSLIAGYLFQGGYLAVTAILGIVAYQSLLIAREGIDPETISRIFE